jgi:hypothetical protein
MSDLKSAAKLALEAFEICSVRQEHQWNGLQKLSIAKEALKEALAKQEQGEPVAEVILWRGEKIVQWEQSLPVGTKFYTTPQQRTWVELTEEERDEIYLAVELGANGEELIEAKLKEKNGA